ncbi:MAG: tetratricopeptide repeat protein [Rhodothermaceae bacterium]|nr:tetratricopeptide repeat protein [Rhodothermaceae bacterium]MYC03545.1 tetratricopeptide repeat protein [Rhodothermaceae bacterium]MYI17794.1 tetratricopeptide repeat protein [Rhodothermaceae bacterium]
MRVFALSILLILFGCTPSDKQPDVTQFILRGNEAFQAGDYTKALKFADSALAHNSNSSDAYFLRGRVYFELEQWDHAEAAYLAVIDLEPDYPGVRHNLGNIYYFQRQYRSALTQFIQATKSSTSANSWHAAGAVYNALSQPDSAAAAFEQAIRLDSFYGPVHTSFADLLEEQGHYPEALERSRIALTIRPNYLPDLLRQGRLLLRLGQSDEAAALLQPLITEYPHHAEPRYLLGQALQRSGFLEQSAEFFSEADSLREIEQRRGQLANTAETQPANFQAQVDYATALRRSGLLEESLKRYFIAQTLRPDNLNLQFHIATLETDLGSLANAEERLLRILAADSSYVLAWLSLATVYGKTNRTTPATNALQQAALINPDHPAVQQFLTRMPSRSSQ